MTGKAALGRSSEKPPPGRPKWNVRAECKRSVLPSKHYMARAKGRFEEKPICSGWVTSDLWDFPQHRCTGRCKRRRRKVTSWEFVECRWWHYGISPRLVFVVSKLWIYWSRLRHYTIVNLTFCAICFIYTQRWWIAEKWVVANRIDCDFIQYCGKWKLEDSNSERLRWQSF